MTTFVFPGQGSQFRGMGGALFGRFQALTAAADAILGYSIEELCSRDPGNRLGQTQYTQPALYVVNAFSYLCKVAENGRAPDFLAGHSLGEVSALFASGAVDFETGLRLVQKRGQLMGEAGAGGMVAIVGLTEERINAIMAEHRLGGLDIANYNAPAQLVVSGPHADLVRARIPFEAAGATCIPLSVSAAFHSRHMQAAGDRFGAFLGGIRFSELNLPVISNVHARPYAQETIAETLQAQITRPVRWSHSIAFLLEQGETEFEEIGPGEVLTRLIEKIRKDARRPAIARRGRNPSPASHQAATTAIDADFPAESLGSPSFRRDFNLKYAYVAGSMYKGIASKALVVRMGKAGLLAYFGTGGLPIPAIEDAIRCIQGELDGGQPYGMNLLYSPERPQIEEDTVDLFLRYRVENVEAAAYLEVTPALVRYRLQGARLDQDGTAVCRNRVLAKVSRPEVARAFLSPAPERIVAQLLSAGRINGEQARLLRQVPMCDALCVEADSGGHTDQGVAATLIPAFVRLRDQYMARFRYPKNIAVGAAGGIGTPEAAAAAFILGADFVLTGSINQCTPEAGNSEPVKDLLEQMDVRDTAYAPAGDMFELGARIQVLKKGLLFPARANKLYTLYRQCNALEELDGRTRDEIQTKYFRCSFDEVYQETCAYYAVHDPQQVARAERDPKHKMALVFRWYFVHSMRLALQGSIDQRVDYQVHCGPALGAFNRWVEGTDLQSWRCRHVDGIAERIMHATATLLSERLRSLYGVPHEAQRPVLAAHVHGR